jgi:hypothetical protein
MKSPFAFLIPGPEGYWSLLFIPALLSYICMLQAALNRRPTLGAIERLDAAGMATLLAPDAVLEVIADGNMWAEGPVWVHDQEEDRGCVSLVFFVWGEGLGGGLRRIRGADHALGCYGVGGGVLGKGVDGLVRIDAVMHWWWMLRSRQCVGPVGGSIDSRLCHQW